MFPRTSIRIAIFLLVVSLAIVLRGLGALNFFEKYLLAIPRPVVRVTQGSIYKLSFLANTYSSFSRIVEEHDVLSERNRELELQLLEARTQGQEAEVLRTQLNFSKKPPADLVPCTVLGRDPSNQIQAVVLSCGSDQGVIPGLAVVYSGQVVAKILQASSGRSIALLLSHPEVAFDSVIGNDRTAAIVRGSFGSGIRAEVVNSDAKVITGDIVSTAGLDPKVPKGLLLGSVGTVSEQIAGDVRVFALVTAVDFRTIDYVFVLNPQ